MTRQQTAIVRIATAVIETIEECGDQGASGGVLYAALMPLGLSFENFQAVMSACVESGRVSQRGQCYFSPRKEVV